MQVFSKPLVIFIVLILSSLTGCNGPAEQEERKNLLIYCGITMIKPMKQLAEEFEKQHPVNITITQGGSQDLYDSLKQSKTGDLYLPGSPSYRINNTEDGLLRDYVFVGYNRVALMVQKGNPKGLTADLQHLTNPNIKTVLCNPQTGSIGKASEKVLKKAGIHDQAYNNAIYLTTDSRPLFGAMRNGEADLTLNWYATGTWPGNKEYVDILELPADISKPKALEISLLSFSKHPDMAKAFMEYASSKHGLTTFRDFGFLTEPEYQQAIQGK
jgi:molybdate transport system substrate-binding protein